MTEAHQNEDEHWVSVMITENRISGNHLSDLQPQPQAILSMQNSCCIPNEKEHKLQIDNYAALVETMITKRIPCLHFLQDVSVKRIHHVNMSKTREPTSTVSFIIYACVWLIECDIVLGQ